MGVDRISVALPAELGAALRELAANRKQPVSAVVAEAIERQIRLERLAEALDAAEEQWGPVEDDDVAEAEAVFARAARNSRS